MAVGREITTHHGEGGLPGILIQRAADQQDCRPSGILRGRVVLGQKLAKLREPDGRRKTARPGALGPGIVAGQKLFEFANGSGELVGARLGAVEDG